MSWDKTGKDLAEKVKGLTDEAAIAELARAIIADIYAQEDDAKERVKAKSRVARGFRKIYPDRETEVTCYYCDPSTKKENTKKWKHLAFKYLTLKSEDWDNSGTPERNKARAEWKAAQSQQSTEQVTEQPLEQPTEQQTEQTIPTLEDVTIDQLELDSETQQILEKALDQSGIPLPDFIRQAVRVYAKTITGKSQKQGEDLSGVPTDKLRKDHAYSTHPGRAEELTKRAIRAIALYNSNIATENADRWMITQSAIASLTGSRQSAIKEIMPRYQTTIDDNNNRPEWQLNPYSNRKPGKKIEEIINLSELCPDGLD